MSRALTPEGREQKLVDICYQLVLTATSRDHQRYFANLTTDQKAEWVRNQLRDCGFDTVPCGSSWGVLR